MLSLEQARHALPEDDGHRMPTALTRWLFDLRTVLLASDPALSRLRMAMRVTLTLIAVGLTLAGLHALTPLPLAAYSVTVITAMQGTLAVRDTTSAARAVTRLYSGLTGFAAIVTATLLAAWPIISDVVFILFVFGAVYARKYGARGNAVGMFAFMCYFIAAYTRPAIGDLFDIALTIILSGAIAHLIRNFVLPERREEDFRHTIVAIGQRLGTLSTMVQAGVADGWTGPTRRQALRQQEKVSDAILTDEGFLPLAAAEAHEKAEVEELTVALFDLHLASETVLMTGLRPGGGRPGPDGSTPLATALGHLDTARGIAFEQAAAIPASWFEGEAAEVPAPAATAARSGWIRDPALRLAIQVTLASAIAMTGGLMLSETRGLWAILTAFLVFINTQSRGDTVVRALQRAAGTLAGIIGGIALATVLHGHIVPSVGLALVFVFTGFYLLQISYAAMTFFVTLVLALLYGLTGQFSPELLVLRLEETLIGVASGIFIAFIVLPQSTSAAAGDAADAFFAALDNLLAAAAQQIGGHSPSPSLMTLSRRLDRRYAALATVARPLGSHWQLVQKPGRVRQALTHFMAIAHWSRILARGVSLAPTAPEGRASLISAIAGLRVQVAEAKGGEAGFFGATPSLKAASNRPEPRPADFSARSADPHFAVDVLSHIVDRAAHGGTRDGKADAMQIS